MLKLVKILLLLISISTFAQKEIKSDTINFNLTDYNNISIKAIINTKDTLNLMLHTASNSVYLTRKITKNLNNLTWKAADSVNSWGGKNAIRNSLNNTIRIGNNSWKGVTFWENKNSGHYTDGKFGLNLYNKKVIEFNNENSKLIIHDTLPDLKNDYLKLPLYLDNDMLFIDAILSINKKDIKTRFLIHSGYSGGVLLSSKFTAENNLTKLVKVIEGKSLKDSYGNVLKTNKAVISGFEIGNVKFNNFPISFFEGKLSNRSFNILGSDVLKRLNFFIDKDRTNIYVCKNGLASQPYFKKPS